MIIGSKVRLRGKRLADALDDYTWQTDPKLTWLDATPPLTITFPQYLSGYASELRHSTPIRRPFAIETLNGKHIGNCVYYSINQTKGEAELGIIIGNGDYRDKGYGTDAVTALVNYIFLKTDLKRIYLKTLETNQRAQKCFKKCGFATYGRRVKNGNNFILMELHRRQWQQRQIETLRQPAIRY